MSERRSLRGCAFSALARGLQYVASMSSSNMTTRKLPWVLSVAALALGAVIAQARPAEACSYPANERYVLDRADASDVTPPQPVIVEVSDLKRYRGTSCDGEVLLRLELTSTDDRTPSDKLGYVVRMKSGNFGQPPPAFGETPLKPLDDGSLIFAVGGSDGPVDMVLELRAVDLHGNLGPPIELHVEEEGGGCSASGGAGAGALASVLVALGMMLGRRRRGAAR